MAVWSKFLFKRSPKKCLAGLGARFWRPGDTEAVNRLYNDPAVRPGAGARGYLPRTAAQWQWEFADQVDGPPPYVVATHRGRIIGAQAYIPIELIADGRTLLSGKDEDTLVHPDYRGLGVLDEMYRLLLARAEQDGVAVLWGFTSTAVRPLLRNGYRSIGAFDALRANLTARPGTAVRRLGALTIAEVTNPDEQCDAFSLEFGRQVGGVMLHLSASFLRWRLFENPYRRHTLYAAYHNQHLVGLAAFKLDDDHQTGYVSELTALPTADHGTEDVLDALLHAGMGLFRACGYRWAETRPAGPHPFNRTLRSLLARHGFSDISNRQAPEFLVRPAPRHEIRLLDMAHWRINELMREY